MGFSVSYKCKIEKGVIDCKYGRCRIGDSAYQYLSQLEYLRSLTKYKGDEGVDAKIEAAERRLGILAREVAQGVCPEWDSHICARSALLGA